jgi:hypothetical protein
VLKPQLTSTRQFAIYCRFGESFLYLVLAIDCLTAHLYTNGVTIDRFAAVRRIYCLLALEPHMHLPRDREVSFCGASPGSHVSRRGSVTTEQSRAWARGNALLITRSKITLFKIAHPCFSLDSAVIYQLEIVHFLPRPATRQLHL